MARVRLGWVWLIALMVAVTAGCGGDDSDTTPPDAASDRRTDAIASDVRTDTPSDVRTDSPTPDATPDATPPPPDAPRPPDADATTPPPPDAPRPDADATTPPPDVPPPPPPDADAAPPPPPDAPDASVCSADNQCPSNRPHCNTTTGACVSAAAVAVSPTNPSIALGTQQQFQATITYSDTSTGPGTSTVTWASTDTGVATIVAGGLATSVAVGPTTISATLGTLSGSTLLTVTNATLVSISVTPPTPSIALGTTQQFMATGTYSNSTTQDLTNQVTWLSETASVATINGAGLATSLTIGDSIIRATFGTVSGTTTLHVTNATLVSIALTPATPTIARLTTRSMTATGRYTDNTTQDLTTQATWSSSDVSVATVSNTAGSQGLVTGAGAGTSTIQATVGAVSGSTVITVTGAALQSISVTPTTPIVAKGLVVPFTATGTYFDAVTSTTTTQNLTTLVTWTSSDPSKAVISNTPGSQGVASTVAAGTTDITATYGTISGMTTLTVTVATLTAIGIQPTSPTIAKGTNQQFTATGTYTDNSTADITTQVTWGSTNAAVGPISNAVGSKGLANGLSGPGDTTISATLSGISASTNLHVTTATLVSIGVSPTNPTIAKGTNKQFTATGTYTDNSTQDLTEDVTWNSSNNSFATIDNAAGFEGLAHGAGVGSVTITATLGTVSGVTNLTVTAATLVSIQLTPPSPTIPKGTTQAFTATGTYSDGTTQNLTELASWSSSNGSIATVNNAAGSRGLTTGNNSGPPTATITAAYGGVSGSTVLTVSAATLVSIAVSPTNRTIAAGTTLQYQATGTYTDTSTQNITNTVAWAIAPNPTSVATISNTAGTWGLVNSLVAGEVDVTANIGLVVGTTHLTVSPATLVRVQVDPPDPSIPVGTTMQFFATGTYTDSTTQDLTAAASWSSSAGNVATISNAAGDEGEATALANGPSIITATVSGVSGTTTLTVNSAALVSIAVTPANLSVANGTKVQYKAIGTYTDSSTVDLTDHPSLTWASAGAQATVSNNLGVDKGLASTNSVGGPFNITATFGSIVGTTPLTVTAATLNSITLAPLTPTIAKGTTVQFVATGHYSDLSSAPFPDPTQVNWGSSNATVATVSNAAGSEGLATGVAPGAGVTITASVGGVTGSTTITVSAATLQSITVNPVGGAINPGDTRPYTATGNYSDATTQDITQLVAWASTVTTVATISNAPGFRGLATGVAGPGDTAITATLAPGTPGSVPLHVNP